MTGGGQQDGGLGAARDPALHVPVLLVPVIEALAPRDGGRYVDGTFGVGGYTRALLAAADCTVYAIDRDPEAVSRARALAATSDGRLIAIEGRFGAMDRLVGETGVDRVDGVALDLGVSSMQLDETQRGFAYSVDAPLDMRMDQSSGLTAADVLNTYDTGALVRVLRDYGEEKFATRIASRIVRERKSAPFTTSGRLVELIREAIPAATRRTGGNPAKRTFQALRIEVNAELAVLERAVPAALDSIAVGGRIVVMAYQSLEDRIVKRALAEGARVRAPHGLPVVPDSMQPWLRLITRGAEKPTAAELAENPRSASVRVRAAERLAVAA